LRRNTLSRVGKNPIQIPKGVEINIEGLTVKVKGPLGNLTQKIHQDIKVKIEGAQVIVTRPSDARNHRSLHGLTRTLVANMVKGVTEGFSKTLTIEGVGFRGEVKGELLVLQLGFSHPVEYKIPKGIIIKMEGQTKIIVTGADKQVVGETAAEIRELRGPEPYKGTGIRYLGEYIKRKVGKTGVAAGAGATK
jgi:large subunit ribosomal protein L6